MQYCQDHLKKSKPFCCPSGYNKLEIGTFENAASANLQAYCTNLSFLYPEIRLQITLYTDLSK